MLRWRSTSAVLIVLGVILTVTVTRGERAFLVSESLPGSDAAITETLRGSVREAGYDVADISIDELLAGKSLDSQRGDLLVIPNGRSLPVAVSHAVDEFTKNGGAMIVCAAPLWGETVNKIDGKWVGKTEYDAEMEKAAVSNPVIDWSKEDLAKWKRGSSNPREDHREIVQDGDRRALHVRTPTLTNWDTIAREVDDPFPSGQTLMVFSAKGGPKTTQLAVEWMEKDGSRWIATVNLSPQWTRYVLPVNAFKAWQPPNSRAADHLHVNDARRLSFGIALSHTDIARSEHEYWIGDIGTAKHPLGDWRGEGDVPVIEGLSPWYQVYPMSDVAAPAEAGMLSLQPRPQAHGFNKGRPWRWQELIEARSPSGEHRGTLAAMILQTSFRTSARAVFTPSNRAFYERKETKQIITDAAIAIRRGLFIKDGGADRFTLFVGDKVTLGARVLNIQSEAAPGVTVRVAVSIAGSEKPVYEKSWRVIVPAASGTTVGEDWTPPSTTSIYVVTADILVAGHVIDHVSHELHLYHPAAIKHFVESRDGGFRLDGKPWKANGVNYMPSSGIGLSDKEIFEHWMGSAGYDPEIVSRDLHRIKAMGFNAVSAFFYRESMESGNPLDFLRQCEELGLKVNLNLRPGTPIESDGKQWLEMIKYDRLAENDTVFAYDLAWEACHWNREYQQSTYGQAWIDWVVKHHKSIEDAAKFWDFAPPMAKEKLAVPTSEMMLDQGKWSKMVIDYRAFLDDLLAERYGRIRDRIRAIDPHHAVSFRMNILADPTAHDPNLLAYDPWGLRHAVDIWEPEGYGRIGDWEWVRPGIFCVSYAKLADPAKPIAWAEIGMSTWDTAHDSPNIHREEIEATFYRDIYRMLRESGSDGVFFWWYPGGYRVDERSDFGIINEDGTDRPVTKVIREEGKKFLAASKPSGRIATIGVDRNKDSRGEYGLYERIEKQFWDLRAKGNEVQLKWNAEPRPAQ